MPQGVRPHGFDPKRRSLYPHRGGSAHVIRIATGLAGTLLPPRPKNYLRPFSQGDAAGSVLKADRAGGGNDLRRGETRSPPASARRPARVDRRAFYDPGGSGWPGSSPRKPNRATGGGRGAALVRSSMRGDEGTGLGPPGRKPPASFPAPHRVSGKSRGRIAPVRKEPPRVRHVARRRAGTPR